MLQRLQAVSKNNQGLTLIELLVFTLIIIVVAVGAPLYVDSQVNKGYDSDTTSALEQAATSLEVCFSLKGEIDFRLCEVEKDVTPWLIERNAFLIQKSSRSGHYFSIRRDSTGKMVRNCDTLADRIVTISCPKGWPQKKEYALK